MKTVTMDLDEGQVVPWHTLAVKDKHRFKIFVCGRKARKTTLLINELAYWAMTDPRGLTYAYLSPFRKQSKNNVWEDHISRVLRLCTQFGIKFRVNLSELTIKFENGSKLQIDGADNAEALRGKSDWGGIAMDEYADWKPYVWQEIIRPNLQVHKAWAIFAGTPKGENHFYQMAKLGDHKTIIDEKPGKTDREFQVFHATSYDNPFNDPEEIDSAKRNTSPDYFRREYLAQFVGFSGLVYPDFQYVDHVQDIDHEFNQHGDYYFGLDFAVRGWSACLVAKVKTDGRIYILDEYKEQGETVKYHSEKIKEMLEKYADLDKYVGYADPAGWARNQQGNDMVWSLAEEYLEEGMPITQGNNEVVGGINYVRQLLNGKKIYIHPRCEKLIAEFYQYQWKEQSDNARDRIEEPEKVRKINDHLLDCLRYMCYSKPTPPTEDEKPRASLFPAKFELKLDLPDPDADNLEEIVIPSLYD
jgi:phage terminase large subunit